MLRPSSAAPIVAGLSRRRIQGSDIFGYRVERRPPSSLVDLMAEAGKRRSGVMPSAAGSCRSILDRQFAVRRRVLESEVGLGGRLRHGGATGLRRGEPLQGLARLDRVDPALPISKSSSLSGSRTCGMTVQPPPILGIR